MWSTWRWAWQNASRIDAVAREAAAAWVDVDRCESRELLTVTLKSINAIDSLTPDKPAYVGIEGTSNTGAAATYSVSSDNPDVTASVVTGGRSIRMTVSGTDSSNQAYSGELTFRLFEDQAPATTARIIQLANEGFYNNKSFHRITSLTALGQGIIIQGGDPNGDGTGGTGTKFDDEFHADLSFSSRGLLAMANSGYDTNDSQFFFTDITSPLSGQPQHLNYKHTIFGILTSGFDTFAKLQATPTQSSRPTNPTTMSNVTVFTDTQNAVVKLSAAAGKTTGSAGITVTANDGSTTPATQAFRINLTDDKVNDLPILGPVDASVTTTLGVAETIQITGTDLDRDNLSFIVRDGTNTSQQPDATKVTVSISQTPATASSPAVATITLTPAEGFVGTVPLIVGVNDRGDTAIRDFNTQRFSFVVNDEPEADNEPPVNTVPASVSDIAREATVALTGLSVADPDAGTTELSVTLTVGAGRFTVRTDVSGGVTAAKVEGNNSSNVVLRGTLAQINATLANASGLNYTAAGVDVGLQTISMTTSDGEDVDSDNFTLQIIATPPINTLPVAAIVAAQNRPQAIIGLSISDPDAGSGNLTVTLEVAKGTLAVNASTAAGLNIGQIQDNGTSRVVITAPLAAINATFASLSGVIFTPPDDFTGQTTFTMTTSDGTAEDVDTANVNVIVLTAPQVTLPAADVIYPRATQPAAVGSGATLLTPSELTMGGSTLVVGFERTVRAVDRLTIVAGTTPFGVIAVSNGSITRDGRAIASFTGGSQFVPLTVTFAQTATADDVRSVLNSVGFQTTSRRRRAQPRIVQTTFTDTLGARSNIATRRVRVS